MNGMKRTKQVVALLAVLSMMMIAASAQQKKDDASATDKPLRGYKVDYALVEMQDGKRVNTRNYTVLVEEEERGNYSPASIRVGMRTPLTAADKDGKATTTYMDVGLNIDCRIKPRGTDKVSVESVIELSNLVAESQANPGSAPVVRSNRSRVVAQLTLGKKTTVASYDDIGSTRSTAVEVTVTQL
jgi:hypothetical protein